MTASEVGRQVQAARVLSNLSQAELARQMRSRGHKWSQPTLTAIEAGERSLKWEEGCELGRLIGFGTVALSDVEIVEQAAKYRRIASIVEVGAS